MGDYGGGRKGSGRKSKYKEKTIVISRRIPESMVLKFDELLDNMLSSFRADVKVDIVDCGCKVLGYTSSGKEILSKCKVHIK